MHVDSIAVHIGVVPVQNALFRRARDAQDGKLFTNGVVCSGAICHLTDQLDRLANDRLCGLSSFQQFPKCELIVSGHCRPTPHSLYERWIENTGHRARRRQ
jgi:hypothetical protein